MHYRYKTKNVCSSEINFDLVEGKLHNVVFTGGCNGNLKAIGKLVEGMDADQVIALLKGNTCGPNFTSCADQLTCSIEEAKANIA